MEILRIDISCINSKAALMVTRIDDDDVLFYIYI